jgi:5-methyltetrahydropteroyltriglutamate--homocysteine methyltransferase
MLETTIAGSLPKFAWLAKPKTLWAPWAAEGAALDQTKRDATLLALEEQEDIGIDIVTDGEMSRKHFVHGFLVNITGTDFSKRVKMGIRDNRYVAEVPTVTGASSRKGSVHRTEATLASAHTRKKLKFTLPGPMTTVDTIVVEHYGDRVRMAMRFAELLNEEARELNAIGCDMSQFDEPAFNVYMKEVSDRGVAALERAAQGLKAKTCFHICYGYGIKANIEWKAGLGKEWRQYESTFPALARSKIGQVSLECINSKVPVSLLGLLRGKDVLLSAIDVATDAIETSEQVVAVLKSTLPYIVPGKLHPCTNCGITPLDRRVAYDKLTALVAGTKKLKAEL